MSTPLPDIATRRRFPVWLPAPNPFSLVTAVFVLCMLTAPLMWFPFDVESCWLPWSRASEGVAPWRIYSTRSDCNYPPLVLYLLTLQEAIRLLIHAQEAGITSIVLTKIPNIIAHLAGALTGYFLLRGNHGETYARRFALLYALSLPLFVNATLWGQADALLALPMVCAVLFLMRGNPIPAGIALGIALTVKLQAIVIAPVLLLYAWKKFGWKPLLQATLAGIAVMLVISLPFIIAGTAEPMLKAYTGAADYYKLRTLNTFNIWSYFNYVDEYVHHLPGKIVNQDDRPAFGPLTYRDVSVSLFGFALLFLLVSLWRRTTAQILAWTAATSASVWWSARERSRRWVCSCSSRSRASRAERSNARRFSMLASCSPRCMR
ncbi:MAG: DUF2029 domain-containing protein, partial [Fibrella sp.]|nr:DUF2029 domain-containing protein [Armatimonadota bacterium]